MTFPDTNGQESQDAD